MDPRIALDLEALAVELAPLVADEISARLRGVAEREQSALLDEHDAARLVGLSPATLKGHRKRRTGPPFLHIGDGKRPAVRYARADLLRWAAERRVDPGQVGARR